MATITRDDAWKLFEEYFGLPDQFETEATAVMEHLSLEDPDDTGEVDRDFFIEFLDTLLEDYEPTINPDAVPNKRKQQRLDAAIKAAKVLLKK